MCKIYALWRKGGWMLASGNGAERVWDAVEGKFVLQAGD